MRNLLCNLNNILLSILQKIEINIKELFKYKHNLRVEVLSSGWKFCHHKVSLKNTFFKRMCRYIYVIVLLL